MNSYNYSTLSDFKNRMSEEDYEFCEQLITNCKKVQFDKRVRPIKLFGNREIIEKLRNFLIISLNSQYPEDNEIKFYFCAEIEKYKDDEIMFDRIITLFDEPKPQEHVLINY